MFPPIHRIFGFVLIVLSLLANLTIIVHLTDHFTNIFIIILIISGLMYFGIFTVYTFKFLRIKHYTDLEERHISNEYVKMIQNDNYKNARRALLLLYYVVFLGSWAFSTYLPSFYKDMTIWQKTMYAYNYTIASFTIMYIYEHQNMNKYLSLDNVGINIISGNNENNDNENNDSNNYNYVTMPDT
jgi:hypothetical protein